MKIAAVIVAAGRGDRLGSATPKAFVSLAGKPLFEYSLATLASHPKITETVLVVPPDRVTFLKVTLGTQVVAGGATRQDSVKAGILALPETTERILVHDAARPFLSPDLIDRLVASLEGGRNAIAALPVGDTLKRVAGETIRETVDREGLWGAQTPQAVFRKDLLAAFQRAEQEGWQATDEALLLERCQVPVDCVMGDPLNFKITTPRDLHFAEIILGSGAAEGDYARRHRF